MMQVKEKPAAIGVATGKEQMRNTGNKTASGKHFCIPVCASIAYLLALVIFVAVLFWPEPIKTVEHTYDVRIGETIWHIANDVKRQGDVRQVDEIVWQICQDNGIRDLSNIHAGDKITVWMQLSKN